MFSSLLRRREWRCRNLERASLRQELIHGWNQKAMSQARWLFVGAGGNGHVIEGAAKKGIGEIHICDKDIVTTPNLNRQKFTERDLFKPKAERLARNVSKQGFLGSVLVPHVSWFQELDLNKIKPHGIVCAVDPSIPGTRLDVSKACIERSIPGVFWAVSTDADWGWVFVQEPKKACLHCAFPDNVARDENVKDRCPATPASCDILMALGALALYTIDTLVMSRARDWNYRTLSLSRSDFGKALMILRKEDCRLCNAKMSVRGV